MNTLEKKIPVFEIADFNKNSNDFLVIEFNEDNLKLLNKLFAPCRTKFYQLMFLSNGELNINLDDENFTLKAGSVLSIPQNHIFTLIPGGHGFGYFILFTDEFICRSNEDYNYFSNYKLFKNSYSILTPESSQFHEIVTVIKNMELEIFNRNTFIKNEVTQHLLKTILIVLERMKRDTILEEVILFNDSHLLKAFRDKLETGFQQNHSVNFYSDSLNITPKKLNRISLNHFGKPVKKIIEERVLLETKRLLKYSSLTVKEISTNVGFSDPAYFNRFFKKFVSVTPVEFRDNVRKVV